MILTSRCLIGRNGRPRVRGQVRTPGRETEISPAGKIVRALTDRLLDLWDVPPDFFRGMADSNLEHPGMVARQSS